MLQLGQPLTPVANAQRLLHLDSFAPFCLHEGNVLGNLPCCFPKSLSSLEQLRNLLLFLERGRKERTGRGNLFFKYLHLWSCADIFVANFQKTTIMCLKHDFSDKETKFPCKNISAFLVFSFYSFTGSGYTMLMSRTPMLYEEEALISNNARLNSKENSRSKRIGAL